MPFSRAWRFVCRYLVTQDVCGYRCGYRTPLRVSATPVCNKRTDILCKKAKPAEKPYKLTDGDGLYPDVPLSRARQKRDDARRLIADGKDPNAERKRGRQGDNNTSEVIAEEWLAKQKHLDQGTLTAYRARFTA